MAKEIKDSYHTMDELYDHRTVLFAIVCKQNKNRCWKSVKHYDGSYEEGWFIAGIETPYGQVTYHQKMEYWDLFDCVVVSHAPFYDGHTPKDALERLKLFYLGNLLNSFHENK